MRKLPVLALAAAASAIAGSAIAAAPITHKMDVPLADGSIAQIEYVGDVAPKVTIAPRPVAADAIAMPFPGFVGFGRMFEEMNRRTQAMVRQAQQVAGQAGVATSAAPYVASVGAGPGTATSTTIVSVSNGGATCTRTTQVVSDGPGKPPKVISNVSGQCAPSSAPAPAGPLSRT